VLSGAYWPAHPHPLRDELLSSWLVHIARANGVKLQRFCDCNFGSERQLWNRDIDRRAPPWLLETLSKHTGTPLSAVRKTTLVEYRGNLFREQHPSGPQQWLLPLMMYHRTFTGYGMQYCPKCLAEDPDPFFRRSWRVAYCTFCTKHRCVLLDRCPNCLAPVAFHRRELGRAERLECGPLSLCHNCDFDLREAVAGPPAYLQSDTFELLHSLVESLESDSRSQKFDLGFHDVLHQLCKLMISDRPHLSLRKFVCRSADIEDRPIIRARLPLEERSTSERHHVLILATWLMCDLPERLRAAWHAKAVRYNHLLKDFHVPPANYESVCLQFCRGCLLERKICRHREACQGICGQIS
jgi:hypothetical protein